MDSIQLNQNHLPEISKRISVPRYDRSTLITGIVHIGVGGFHRSHQAYYIHHLLGDLKYLNWGICGVGLREEDRTIHDVFKKQDCLYTLMMQHPDGRVESEVIGSIKEFLLAVDTPDLVIGRMAHANTKIVSLTITEGGYNFNPSTGDFNFDSHDIKHELKYPDKPKTVFGFLTEALRMRRSKGVPPFSILSCDNIQHNGDVARKMLLSFAKRQDVELAEWISNNVSFPNTMVDRITPVTTSESINYLQSTYNFNDEWPVVCEPFIQWVVEDDFSNGRPPLEKLGFQFVTDVSPYEKMKIRLLNAGHSVLAIPGAIHGHLTINACIEDPVFKRFMRQFMDHEVSPILDDIEGIDIEKYKDSLAERFSNPNIKDSVSRICSESSAKLPKFLIPTLQDNLASNGSIKYAVFILAAWCYYNDKGRNEKNELLEIIDSMKFELHHYAKNTDNDNVSFLKLRVLFGDIVDHPIFVESYVQAIQLIYKKRSIRKLMENLMVS